MLDGIGHRQLNHALVAGRGQARVERQLAQDRQAEVLGDLLDVALAKERDLLAAVRAEDVGEVLLEPSRRSLP